MRPAWPVNPASRHFELARQSRKARRLFYLACLPARLLVAFAALLVGATARARVVTVMIGAAGGVIALGFCIAAISGRSHGFGGGQVWWGNYRVVHASLWSTFACLMITMGSAWAATPLFADVALALCFALYRPNDSTGAPFYST